MRIVVECKDTDEIIGAKETIAAAIDGLADIKFINVETESDVMGKQFFTDYVRHMARFYFRSDLG